MNTPGHRGLVLVLEDDPGISRLQKIHLERAGYRADVATSTAAARAKLSKGRIDLLLFDYQLNEPTNGLEFYRSLQSQGYDVPAILVTGFGDETRILEAMRAGVRDFIPKTQNFVELVVPTVDRVMKQVRSERQLLEAEAASQAKDHFLATLSHELRTPLTPVLALVSALRRDERLPQDVQEDISIIFRNIELEARLIDDLLDITRIARGKLELQFDTRDISPIILHAINTCCAHECSEKMIVCLTELAEGEHAARVDAGRLTQVFWNLLKNAIKFTPAGGRISVRSRRELNDGSPWLAVEFQDTGIGITADALPRIFDAFVQEDRKITRQFGGLGLGLAISKAIMDAHSGTISAHSEGPGKGSTFCIRLPLCSPAETTGVVPETSPPIPAENNLEAPATRLLLVEDHADTAHVLARMLDRAGFRVTVAACIAEGLAEVAAAQTVDANGGAHPIRLVISDLGLPDGSGTELMRELSEKYHLPGIALSGFGMEDDVRRSKLAGFWRHLTKPVDFELLLANIREVLAQLS